MIKKINFDYNNNYDIYLADIIDSTNDYFKLNYNKYLYDSILIALRQTKGRGRYNRIWESDNDIIFSILKFNNNYYHIITPLAIILALNELGYNSLIKWPNDIYLNNKKLSGILIEDIYENEFKASIIGIGLNMTDKCELNGIGLNTNLDKYYIINKIINKFDELSNKSFKYLINEYKKYSMVIGKNIIYKNEEYKAIDINELGYLIISNDFKTLTLTSDEINIKEALINEN